MNIQRQILLLERITSKKIILIEEWFNIKSSNIEKVEYERKTKSLSIKFNNSSKIYIFKNVPIKVYAGLMWSNSKGKFFHRRIKNKFDFK